MTTITDTTAAAHPAPTWAADPSTDVKHERGEGVHPDDAHTSYTRQLASWQTTPELAHLSPIALQVTLHAWRHDDGSDDFDTACVWEDGEPGHLVAADARRLGQVLLQAADELEGRVEAPEVRWERGSQTYLAVCACGWRWHDSTRRHAEVRASEHRRDDH